MNSISELTVPDALKQCRDQRRVSEEEGATLRAPMYFKGQWFIRAQRVDFTIVY